MKIKSKEYKKAYGCIPMLFLKTICVHGNMLKMIKKLNNFLDWNKFINIKYTIFLYFF